MNYKINSSFLETMANTRELLVLHYVRNYYTNAQTYLPEKKKK